MRVRAWVRDRVRARGSGLRLGSTVELIDCFMRHASFCKTRFLAHGETINLMVEHRSLAPLQVSRHRTPALFWTQTSTTTNALHSDICVCNSCPDARVQSEDGATWPQQTGQDFSNNFSPPDIDFSEIHMWPDDWSEVRKNVCM